MTRSWLALLLPFGCTFTGSSGGDGSGDPDPPAEALVVRYFFDAAETGLAPAAAIDSEAPPIDLALETAGGLHWCEPASEHRALCWAQAGSADRARGAATAKLRDRLDATDQSTIELVLQVDEAGPEGSGVFEIRAPGGNPGFTLQVTGTRMPLTWGPAAHVEVHANAITGAGARRIVQIVIDSRAEVPSQRVRATVDGAIVNISEQDCEGETFCHYPDPGTELAIQQGAELVVGNRLEGGRAFRGSLHYLAIYDRALSDEQLQDTRRALRQSDDGP
jgi:hypothetical protein